MVVIPLPVQSPTTGSQLEVAGPKLKLATVGVGGIVLRKVENAVGRVIQAGCGDRTAGNVEARNGLPIRAALRVAEGFIGVAGRKLVAQIENGEALGS